MFKIKGDEILWPSFTEGILIKEQWGNPEEQEQGNCYQSLGVDLKLNFLVESELEYGEETVNAGDAVWVEIERGVWER